MGERRFVIAEMPTDEEGSIESITEAELMRRLNLVCELLDSPERTIDILIHGEGGERRNNGKRT